MIQQTSLMAFSAVSPKISRHQRMVYDLLRLSPEPISNNEIAVKLGWSINRVTPRTLELRKMGLIKRYEIRKDTFTKNNVYTLVPIFPMEII